MKGILVALRGMGTPGDVATVRLLASVAEVGGSHRSHLLFVDSTGDVWARGQTTFGQIGRWHAGRCARATGARARHEREVKEAVAMRRGR